MEIGTGFSDQDIMMIRTFSGICMGSLRKRILQSNECEWDFHRKDAMVTKRDP